MFLIYVVILNFSLLKIIYTGEPSNGNIDSKAYYFNFVRNKHFEKKLLDIDKENTLGIGFSGGAFRAYAASLGQILALYDLGLLKRPKTSYVSCVSGGCLATSIFFYGKFNNLTEIFCDVYKDPRKIQLNDFLKPIEKNCASKLATKDINVMDLKLFTDKGKYKKPFLEDYLKKEFFQIFSGKENVDINYFSTSKEKLNFPFHIMNANVYDLGGKENIVPFEITPFYSGVPLNRKVILKRITKMYHNYATVNDYEKVSVGGYWLDTSLIDNESVSIDHERLNEKVSNSYYYDHFLFNSEKYKNLNSNSNINKNKNEKQIEKNFNLEKIPIKFDPSKNKFGALQALTIPINILEVMNINNSLKASFSRKFNIFQIDENLHSRFVSFNIGDAGYTDNLGLGALLRRKMRNIILFINSNRPIKFFKKENSGPKEKINAMSNYLSSFFGIFPKFFKKDKAYFNYNQVFQKRRFDELIRKLHEKKKKKEFRVVELENLEVLRNDFLGVEGNWIVKKLTIFYLNKSEVWLNSLNKEVREEIEKIKDFPLYKLIGNKKIFRSILGKERIKSLSSLTYFITFNYLKEKLNIYTKEEIFYLFLNIPKLRYENEL